MFENVLKRLARGYSRKRNVSVWRLFHSPLPYLWLKSVIFPNLFMTRPKVRYPTYDRCGWHSCPGCLKPESASNNINYLITPPLKDENYFAFDKMMYTHLDEFYSRRHSNDPIVFSHRSVWMQLCVAAVHSSTSESGDNNKQGPFVKNSLPT